MKNIKATTKVSKLGEESTGKTLHFPIVKEAYINTPKRKTMDEWYQMMYKLGEHDEPYLTFEGVTYTPRELYEIYKNRLSLWNRIKEKLI